MLCGREAEIELLMGLQRDARAGRSGVLVVSGEAGSGKTTLLEYARAATRGTRVLEVRGSAPERNLAFAGLAQLVRPVAHEIAHLAPAQANALRGAVALGPPLWSDRFAVYAATLSLVGRLAEEQPVLLTIDDAHVLDTPSAEAFGFTARRLVAEGVAILFATRPEGTSQGWAGRLTIHGLPGLDACSAAELIDRRTGVRPHRWVLNRLLRDTAGNAMALLEVTGKLSSAQLRGRVPMPDLIPAEATAGAMFAQRVAALGEPAHLALLLLSSTASSQLRPVLQAADILLVPESGFTELETAELVTFTGGAFRFVHPLVTAAAISAASPMRRRAAHRALAAVLTGGVEAAERAWHLAEATLGVDERVAAELEEMAGAARARAGYAAAVTALERASALSEDSAARARRLYAAASDAQLAGQNSRARELLCAAWELTEDPDLRLAVASTRSRVELITGHPAVAHEIMRQAAQITDAKPEQRAQLLADSAMAALLAGDARAALETGAEAERLGAGERVGALTGLVQGVMLLHLGRHAEGAPLISRSIDIGRRSGADRLPVEYLILCAGAAVWIGEFELAHEVISPVLTELRSSGAFGMLPFALYVLASADARRGRIGAARAAATEAAELADLTGDTFWQYLGLSALTYVEAVRGDETLCRDYGEKALAIQRPDTDYPRDAIEALGLLELSLGRYDEAVLCFYTGAASTPGVEPGGLIESNADFLEAYVRSGRILTGRMAEALAESTGAGDFPLHAATAWRVRGLVATDDAFAPCFANSLALHVVAECPFETARTHLMFGERLRRARKRVEAREQLRAALERFERLDARVWAGRARSELAATGATVRRNATPSALESLTPQEYQVAAAVTRGASNREVAAALFLSTKTVEFHLGSVYRKLQVRTRTELAHRYPDLADR
jgi:DNA-binding CsgD family transcriptional regulator